MKTPSFSFMALSIWQRVAIAAAVLLPLWLWVWVIVK